MKVINLSNNAILGNNIKFADSFILRLLGLIPKKVLHKGEGLIIKPCNSIHMLFMNFSIDVLFLDKDCKVIYLLENFKPWKISRIIKGSAFVIELPAETIKYTNTKIGDIIKIGL